MNYIKSIGIGLLAIGGFIFFLGLQVKAYNLLFLLTGGVIGAIGIGIALIVDNKETKVLNNDFLNWKNHLINNGIKVEVDLDKCVIKSNSYQEELVKDYSLANKYMAFDGFAGKGKIEYRDVKQCVLVFDAEVHGNPRTFYSSVIYKDEITLTFLLSNKKKTYIYLDRSNKDNYYFDLEFLKD